MKSPEKQLYDSASAYYEGAMLLMQPPEGRSSAHLLAQPAVTCAALSLKLYLKCLLAIEGRDNDDIYGIVNLYRAFKDETRNLLLGKFDEFSNSQLTSADLVKHLEALDNSFVRWRYIHEENARNVNLEDLEEMILAARAAISSLRPDWQ